MTSDLDPHLLAIGLQLEDDESDPARGIAMAVAIGVAVWSIGWVVAWWLL